MLPVCMCCFFVKCAGLPNTFLKQCAVFMCYKICYWTPCRVGNEQLIVNFKDHFSRQLYVCTSKHHIKGMCRSTMVTLPRVFVGELLKKQCECY